MLKNILIIDDDERLRELLDEYLTEKNYKIYHISLWFFLCNTNNLNSVCSY